MSTSSEPYVSYDNNASHSNWNLSSVAWVIFAPNGELVSLRGICISRSTNNIVEYSAVVKFLSDVISHGIDRLVNKLDS